MGRYPLRVGNSVAVSASFALIALVSTSAVLMGAERIACRTVSPNEKQCRIDEPHVRTAATDYPSVTFQAGDIVTVNAGGCVQTGGTGSTWKRYVNPLGFNSERYYRGLINIAGATAGLQPITGIIGQLLTVPRLPGRQMAYLQLGYQDDDYGDNGYNDHDDGTQNQCRGLSNAFVEIKIRHGQPGTNPPGPPREHHGPMDLVWRDVDWNLLPLQPQWYYQTRHAARPDAAQLCGGFSYEPQPPGSTVVTFGSPPCTTQHPTVDHAGGLQNFICAASAFLPNRVMGHVNWGPIMSKGAISWETKSDFGSDDDYNMLLQIPGSNGYTTLNSALNLEFDSDETIDHFRSPWWQRFHEAVDRGNDDAKRVLPNGSAAVVVGLMNLDCAHGCKAESHPVYGLAIRVKNDPSDETWAIFARNWGNEGYCSQDPHDLNLPSNVLYLSLPRRPGATSYSVLDGNNATQFSSTIINDDDANQPNFNRMGWSVSSSDNQTVEIAFQLLRPAAHSMVHGELHLKWVQGSALSTLEAFPFTPVEAGQPTQEPEDAVRALIGSMTPAQRRVYDQRMQGMSQPAGANTFITARRATLSNTASVGQPRTTDRGTDLNKSRRDRVRAEALCAAFNGSIPGFPSGCSSMTPPR